METQTYEQVLEEKGRLVYTNVGTSMMPLLRQKRDLMIIDRRPYNEDGSFAPLKKFDAVLYTRGERYILHRIVAVHENGSAARTYDILGDNQWRIEYGVSEERILGVLTGVVRDGVQSDFTDAKSRLYLFAYCDCLQLRRGALRCRDACLKAGHEFAARTRTGAALKRLVRGTSRKENK